MPPVSRTCWTTESRPGESAFSSGEETSTRDSSSRCGSTRMLTRATGGHRTRADEQPEPHSAPLSVPHAGMIPRSGRPSPAPQRRAEGALEGSYAASGMHTAVRRCSWGDAMKMGLGELLLRGRSQRASQACPDPADSGQPGMALVAGGGLGDLIRQVPGQGAFQTRSVAEPVHNKKDDPRQSAFLIESTENREVVGYGHGTP